jgi:hypothetical protein
VFGQDVKVRIGTGTARSWINTDIEIDRCGENCPEYDGMKCQGCSDKLKQTHEKANEIISTLKKDGKIDLATFTDDCYNDESDCYLTQIRFKSRKLNP